MAAQTVNLELSYADAELLQEALADAVRFRSKDPEQDMKTRFDYRYLMTQIGIQLRDNGRTVRNHDGV